jgi:hypothetical protein
MMKRIACIGLLLIAWLSSTAFAQNLQNNPELELRRLLSQAQQQMMDNEYEAANQTFRRLLKLQTKIPADVSYLFAETLYMIGQYKNSENFLKKYLDLTGVNGDYFKKATELQGLLKERMTVSKTCMLCDVNGYITKQCDLCSGSGTQIRDCNFCKGRGHVMCQLCAGEGVRITRSAFGDRSYESCGRCSAKGYHTCPVCDGQKVVDAYCEQCLGLTYMSTNKICKHEPVVSEQ